MAKLYRNTHFYISPTTTWIYAKIYEGEHFSEKVRSEGKSGISEVNAFAVSDGAAGLVVNFSPDRHGDRWRSSRVLQYSRTGKAEFLSKKNLSETKAIKKRNYLRRAEYDT